MDLRVADALAAVIRKDPRFETPRYRPVGPLKRFLRNGNVHLGFGVQDLASDRTHARQYARRRLEAARQFNTPLIAPHWKGE